MQLHGIHISHDARTDGGPTFESANHTSVSIPPNPRTIVYPILTRSQRRQFCRNGIVVAQELMGAGITTAANAVSKRDAPDATGPHGMGIDVPVRFEQHGADDARVFHRRLFRDVGGEGPAALPGSVGPNGVPRRDEEVLNAAQQIVMYPRLQHGADTTRSRRCLYHHALLERVDRHFAARGEQDQA